MINLKYMCCVILISRIINGGKLDGKISDADESINEEDNIIEDEYPNEKNHKVYFENDDMGKKESRESAEQESKESELKKVLNGTRTIDSKEGKTRDDEEKKELVNKIDNSEITEKGAVDDDDKDNSSEESSSEKSILHEYHDEAKKLMFRNCRDRDTDEICRNTLIDYPYAVSIQRLGSHYATGVLLDKRWILTAAAEFYNIRESIKLFRARLGSVNCKRGGVSMPLQEVIVHPLFVPDKPGYDLALLRLGLPVEYSDFIKPIRLSSARERVLSANFLTMYWPRLIVRGEILPHNASERAKPTSLRVSTQRLVSSQYCQKMLLDMNVHLKEASLCLKPLVTHHSLCMPDPGAPIVADDGLWGITSSWTSKLCFKMPGPTIFTRISAPLVRSWLDSKLLEM